MGLPDDDLTVATVCLSVCEKLSMGIYCSMGTYCLALHGRARLSHQPSPIPPAYAAPTYNPDRTSSPYREKNDGALVNTVDGRRNSQPLKVELTCTNVISMK